MRNNRYDRYDYDYKYNNYGDYEETNEEELFGLFAGVKKFFNNFSRTASKTWNKITELGEELKDTAIDAWKSSDKFEVKKKVAIESLNALATASKETIKSKKTIEEVQTELQSFTDAVNDMINEFKKGSVKAANESRRYSEYDMVNENLYVAFKSALQSFSKWLENAKKSYKENYDKNMVVYKEDQANLKAKKASLEAAKRQKQGEAAAEREYKAAMRKLEATESKNLAFAKKEAIDFIEATKKEVKNKIENQDFEAQAQGKSQAQIGAQSGKTKSQKELQKESRVIATFEGFVHRYY